MGKQLKISADTTPVKKSLLDLSKTVKGIGNSKVKVFSEGEKRFIRTELNKEIKAMKTKMTENKQVISEMIKEHRKLKKGTEEELKMHEKIVKAMKTQSKLAKEHGKLTGMKGAKGGGGGIGMGGTLMRGLGGLAAGGLLLAGGAVLGRGIQAQSQYRRGVGDRVRLQGLGVNDETSLSPTQLANAGLTEQEFNRRRMESIATLGRDGTSEQSILQQARMERAMGLEGGTFTNIATSLRANFGGAGGDDAQMKLQASILSSGMEDALGPYLDAATSLLNEINENGMTQTDELVNMMGQLAKDGNRTPEQIAKIFSNVDQAIKGSSGESNAFMQAAFAQGGIGNGTIGGTRLAISSGGIFGLSQDALAKRGYSESEIEKMSGLGLTSGSGERINAVMDRFKRSAGMDTNADLSSADANQMVGLAQMSNSIFGTQGMQGYDALKMLEKVQRGDMSQEQFEEKLQEIKEGKDPQAEKLATINESLAGQTDVISTLNENLMEQLGKSTVKITNKLIDIENAVLMSANPAAEATVDTVGSGALVGAGSGALAGAAIGSVVPVLGTALGALLGAGIGGAAGYFMSDSDPKINRPNNSATTRSGLKQEYKSSDQLEKAIKELNQNVKTMNKAQSTINVNTKTNVNMRLPSGKVKRDTF